MQEEKCAGAILSTLMRRAYRRPIAKAEVEKPMAFYRKGRAEGDFDAGITMALSAVLTNPEFLFRVESDPKKVPANGIYRISVERIVAAHFSSAALSRPVGRHTNNRRRLGVSPAPFGA